MADKHIYLTAEGLEDLKKEHQDLSKVRRPEVVARVSNARELGDLSENAEYQAARDELAFIDGRLEELEDILKKVQVIKDHTGVITNVDLGSTVTLEHKGKNEDYMVVGEWEADPIEKKISHASPLGKALLGKKVGENIEVEAPAGKIIYTIISVK
jgi:transcription elongation factor GreA